MRLTLRTMLAYLDDVLEPADAELLAKKIDESEFATGLVHRVKGVLRKLRMDAPKLDGKGMGNDANTVAEYLDSSLPQDRVGEFERVCLESDKHLCEVAACHQVLTLVLGKPADVRAELRDRIYALGDPARAAVHASAPVVAAAAAGTVPPPVPNTNGRPAEEAAPPLEVPEYLRAGRQSSIWPFVAVGGTALVLTLLVVWQVSKLNKNPKGGQQVAMAPEESAKGKSEAEGSSSSTSAPTDAHPAAAETAESTATSTESAVVPAATTEPTPASATPASPPDDRPANESTEKPAAATPSPPGPPITDASDVPMAPAAKVIPKAPKAKSPPAAPPKPQAIEVGRYTSDGQLLATLDADGLWYPKQAQEVLVAGERVVVLPAYRSQIALPSAVQLTFSGEGSALMEAPDENNIPRVKVEYGRFVAATAGKAGAQVELNLAGIKGTLSLVDGDTVVAIKVIRWVAPGTDPEAAEGIPVVEIYTVSGRATWRQTDHAKVDLPTRHVHVYYGDDPPETHGPFYPPDWIDDKNVRPIDRVAREVLERMIDPERSLNVSLNEMMKDRRVEVRSLAARCLAAIGDFEAVIRELADVNQYSFWSGEFEALRRALSRGPDTAAKVHETLNLLRAADAKDLYRLLWGYSEEQLEKGAAKQLVDFLKHEQTDVRVLAFVNLVSITGVQSLYQPQKPPAQMKTPIRDWEERLKKATIIYKGPPSPLDRYRPVEGAAPEPRATPPAAAAPR